MPTGFVDTRRSILAIEGQDIQAVLQGVVTNDVDKLARDHVVYTALLTPQGKYLFDFFLLWAAPERILIDVAGDRAAALAQRLKMYCLRRDAAISGDSGLGVAVAWPDAGPDPNALCVADPRHPALGWRLYGADPQALLTKMGATSADRADYDAIRVAERIPESGIELVPDDTYILEAGFERLAGVDFKKGCYVGQEVTARMKHKAALRKGLVQVQVAGTAPPGTPITTGGKPAGTLFTTSGSTGLAHLRLDRAGTDMQAGAATVHYSP